MLSHYNQGFQFTLTEILYSSNKLSRFDDEASPTRDVVFILALLVDVGKDSDDPLNIWDGGLANQHELTRMLWILRIHIIGGNQTPHHG